MDFDGIIPALQAKKFEVAIASMSITADRAKVVDFSDMYFNVPGRLLAKAGAQINDAWYKGKNIGVLRSTVQEQEGRDKMKPKGASSISTARSPMPSSTCPASAWMPCSWNPPWARKTS